MKVDAAGLLTINVRKLSGGMAKFTDKSLFHENSLFLMLLTAHEADVSGEQFLH